MSRTHYQQIALRPLDAEAAGELLGEWLGPDPSLEGFPELVRERTGGNPFFMEEVVQSQIESGALTGARGHFKLERPIESLEVPVSVQSLLAARIDLLEEETKRLLQTAAVVGVVECTNEEGCHLLPSDLAVWAESIACRRIAALVIPVAASASMSLSKTESSSSTK